MFVSPPTEEANPSEGDCSSAEASAAADEDREDEWYADYHGKESESIASTAAASLAKLKKVRPTPAEEDKPAADEDREDEWYDDYHGKESESAASTAAAALAKLKVRPPASPRTPPLTPPLTPDSSCRATERERPRKQPDRPATARTKRQVRHETTNS